MSHLAKTKKKKNKDYFYLLLPVIAALCVSLGFYVKYTKEQEESRLEEEARKQVAVITTESTYATRIGTTEVTTEEKKKQDVIDFVPLKKRNKHVYAWIKVPGTEVDYPILQHPKDNEFYLHHNIDKQEDIYGAIYTENYNEKDFLDPCTIIYGHNMNNGSMFGSLHRFESHDFFKKHRKILIYTEEDEIEYKIFATFVHTNQHLFYGYQFDIDADYERFLADVFAHTEEEANIDQDMDVTSDDNILVLSTCNHGIAEQRYLVVAKRLTED